MGPHEKKKKKKKEPHDSAYNFLFPFQLCFIFSQFPVCYETMPDKVRANETHTSKGQLCIYMQAFQSDPFSSPDSKVTSSTDSVNVRMPVLLRKKLSVSVAEYSRQYSTVLFKFKQI